MFKKDRGLGDTVHRFTKATGIKTMVDRISHGLNIPCGCEGRQEAMNIMFPYRRNKNKTNGKQTNQKKNGGNKVL